MRPTLYALQRELARAHAILGHALAVGELVDEEFVGDEVLFINIEVGTQHDALADLIEQLGTAHKKQTTLRKEQEAKKNGE